MSLLYISWCVSFTNARNGVVSLLLADSSRGGPGPGSSRRNRTWVGFFSIIISFLHPSLSQPQILFFFFYFILRCFSVWSLLSLMLSCVVHRWKTKKINILQSFYVNIPSKRCVFFQNANRLDWFFCCCFFFIVGRTLLSNKIFTFVFFFFPPLLFWSKVQWRCNIAFSTHLLFPFQKKSMPRGYFTPFQLRE